MVFSATGFLLPGPLPYHMGEVKSYFHKDKDSQLQQHRPAWTYRFGKIPILSTGSGIVEAFLGLVHAIVHLVFAIFKKNRAHHLEEASLGAKHMALGLTAAVPLVGNFAMALYTKRLVKRIETLVNEKIIEVPSWMPSIDHDNIIDGNFEPIELCSKFI